MTPIFTCVKGTNADLFPDILELYVPKGSMILDMTYGRGVFWRKVDITEYKLIKNDIDQSRGDFHFDFGNTSWDNEIFDAICLDPPYLLVGGFDTLKDSLDRGYKNKIRAASGITGVAKVMQMYTKGFIEAHRLLKNKGIFIVKIMDQIESGKQQWLSLRLIQLAELLGFNNEDWFILMHQGTPLMRHKHQIHARRNHSHFLIFRKRNR